MELKSNIFSSPFSKHSRNDLSIKKLTTPHYMLSLYSDATKNDNEFQSRSNNKYFQIGDSRIKSLTKNHNTKSGSAPKQIKVSPKNYQEHILQSKSHREDQFIIKSNFIEQEYTVEDFEKMSTHSFFMDDSARQQVLNEDSEFIKQSYHRSFIIEKTCSDSNSLVLKDNKSYITAELSHIPTKSSYTEKIDFKKLYLNSVEQVNELRRLHKLELDTIKSKFEKVLTEFQKKQLEDFKRNQELTTTLEELEKLVSQNDKTYAESLKNYELKNKELKSFVFMLKERLEEELEKKNDCMCHSLSNVQQENTAFVEKNKKLEQKLAYYEKYLFRSLKKMVEFFGILVLGEKPRISNKNVHLRSVQCDRTRERSAQPLPTTRRSHLVPQMLVSSPIHHPLCCIGDVYPTVSP